MNVKKKKKYKKKPKGTIFMIMQTQRNRTGELAEIWDLASEQRVRNLDPKHLEFQNAVGIRNLLLLR